MSLLPHQQRVVDELAELTAKRTKLGSFIVRNLLSKPPIVPRAESVLLNLQHEVMGTYESILTERVAAF